MAVAEIDVATCGGEAESVREDMDSLNILITTAVSACAVGVGALTADDSTARIDGCGDSRPECDAKCETSIFMGVAGVGNRCGLRLLNIPVVTCFVDEIVNNFESDEDTINGCGGGNDDELKFNNGRDSLPFSKESNDACSEMGVLIVDDVVSLSEATRRVGESSLECGTWSELAWARFISAVDGALTSTNCG